MDQNRGYDIHQLQHEWDLLCLQGNVLPLVQALRQKVTGANKTNCVLTFPSDVVVSGRNRLIQICYLYGSKAHCINAFLRRELETGRNMDVNSWIQHNRDIYTAMNLPSIEPYRIHVFTREGHHRSHADIWGEVSKVIMHSKQGRAADG